MTKDVTPAEKRAVLNRLMTYKHGAVAGSRWSILYREFEEKYHFNLDIRIKNYNKNPDNKKCKSRVAAYNGQSVQMHGFSDSTDRYATDRNGRRLFNYSGFQSETRFEPSIFSMEFNEVSQPEKKYIHSYNYKPDYIPHYIENENPETTLLLGAEIEVAGNHSETDRRIKEDTVKKCIQIMNGSDSDEESLIYSTHDGTVQIGMDVVI